MRRIGLTVILALSLALVPLAAGAQQAGTIWRIGYLSNHTDQVPEVCRRRYEVIQ
jgi:hypothetical protein